MQPPRVTLKAGRDKSLRQRHPWIFSGAVENILRVLPDTANVAVVIGNSLIEKYWLEQIRDELRPWADRVTFTWFNDLSFDEMLAKHI